MSVSVIIPVYNGEKYLAEAIGSVLRQDVPGLEVIVVDDGSRDGSVPAARTFRPRVSIVEQEHRGPGAARNSGARAATREFLAFLDCDDYWAPGKLARQLARFEADPAPDIVFTHVLNFYSPELTADQRSAIVCPPEPMPGIIPSTLLIRRSSFESVGPFPEDVVIGELVPWLARARDLGMRIETLPEVLAYRRLHESNLGRREKDRRGDYLKMVHRVMLGRSARGGAA
jgi:glycosyltransferase involved in cell wall biosynthesis